MSIALRTTEYLNKEREWIPWSAAGSQLGYVGTMLERHPLYGSFTVCMSCAETKILYLKWYKNS